MKYQIDSLNVSFQCSLSQYIAIISHVMCRIGYITDTTIAGNTNEVDSEIINEFIL